METNICCRTMHMHLETIGPINNKAILEVAEKQDCNGMASPKIVAVRCCLIRETIFDLFDYNTCPRDNKVHPRHDATLYCSFFDHSVHCQYEYSIHFSVKCSSCTET